MSSGAKIGVSDPKNVDNKGKDGADGKKEKKRWLPRNPWKVRKEREDALRAADEARLLQKEETMKQNLERYLMEIEEKHSWITLVLKERNFIQMVKKEHVRKILHKEEEIEKARKVKEEVEIGLSFLHGDIVKFTRWQNSPAKRYDLKGHTNAVKACKLSKCLRYVVSASTDGTAKLWSSSNNKCIMTWEGHSRPLNDIDIHPEFEYDEKKLSIVTCSGDATLMYWNSRHSVPKQICKGHSEAVYKCSFSADGGRVVSCSEDQTVRTWCFPEGFCLFVYKGHQSPVVCARFSPSGRFILSGSDYGERKLFLWNANMPNIEDTVQYPHTIFWNPDGLIKRICMRRKEPLLSFWVDAKKMDNIDPRTKMEVLPGENAQDEEYSSSDSEKDEEEDLEPEKAYNEDDVRDLEGVAIFPLYKDPDTGKQEQVEEYIPGGKLGIVVQSVIHPISELFISVQQKETQFDTFVENSGTRMGSFRADAPLPWEEDEAIVDVFGKNPPKRPHVPEGLADQANGKGIYYQETIKRDEEGNDLPGLPKLEVTWECGDPDLGNACIICMVKLRYNDKWHKLTYTMKESYMRIKPPDANGEEAPIEDSRYDFDPVARHEMFMNFIREKNFDGAYAMLDRKTIVIYNEQTPHKRRKVVRRLLERMFAKVHAIVLAGTFELKMGVTRASMCMEASEVPPPEYLDHGDDSSSSSSSDSSSDEDEQFGGEDGYDTATTNESADDDGQPIDTSATITSTNEDGEIIDNVPGRVQEIDIEAPLDPIPESVEEEDSNVNSPSKSVIGDGGEVRGVEVTEKENRDDNYNDSQSGSEGSISNSGSFSGSEHSSGWVHQSRPRTQEKKFDSVLFTSNNMGKSFDRKVQHIAEEEAKMITKMETDKLVVRDEVRNYKLNPAFRFLKFLKKAPKWIWYGKTSQKKVRLQIEEEEYDEEEEIKNLVKGGRFGPEIRDFSMSLPEYFPKTAGMAEGAVKDAMSEYKTILKKMEKKALPAELDSGDLEDDEYSWWDKVLGKDKASLAKSLKRDIGLYHLAKSAYNTNRRLSQPNLDGLVNHYPNNLYAPFAAEVDSKDLYTQDLILKRLKKRKKDKNYEKSFIFTKTGVKVPAVGRNIHLKVRNARDLGPEVVEKDPDAPLEAIFDDGTENKDGEDGGQEVEGVKEDTEGEKAHEDSTDTKGELNKTDGSNNGMKEAPDDMSILTGDPLMYGLNFDQMDGDTANDAQFGSTTINDADYEEDNEKALEIEHDDDEDDDISEITHNNKKKGNDPYLERRGSFPVAPGLKLFQGQLEGFRDDLTPDDDMKPEDKDEYLEEEELNNQQIDYVATGGFIRSFKTGSGINLDFAHHGAVNCAVFSPSERQICSAGGDMEIKLWDPRDASVIRALLGHSSDVMGCAYTDDELYMVSCGADYEIIIWDMNIYSMFKRLRGHVDIVYEASISSDCTFVVSCSHDHTIKTWFLTPREPDPPDPPVIIYNTDRTALLEWSTPPSFNEELTAFFIQHRVGSHGMWKPNPPVSIPPSFRTKQVENLIPSTCYQFRMMAENRMGKGEWGPPSKMIMMDYGIPDPLEQPTVSACSRYTITIFWFTQNPAIFGAAPKKFLIQKSGEGKDFDEFESWEGTLDGGKEYGEKILEDFRKAITEAGANTVIHQPGERTKMDTKADPHSDDVNGIDFPVKHMEDILDRKEEDNDYIFVAFKVTGFKAGTMYRIRTQAVNRSGTADWSEPSYSVYTVPGIPEVPQPPKCSKRGLNWLELEWTAPADGGTAITGYRIWIKHYNRSIDVNRTVTKYVIRNLRPGKPYYIKILAKNLIGWSDYCEYNSLEDGTTDTAPPEVPSQFTAVGATWDGLTLEGRLPYHNGSDIHHLQIQKRYVEAFSKGEWEHPSHIRVPEDVTILEHVEEPPEEDQDQSAKDTCEIEYHPFAWRWENKAMKGDLTLWKEEMVFEYSKPELSKIAVTIDNLNADTIYEFRVCGVNKSGPGDYSVPSQRAKTKKQAAPGKGRAPMQHFVAPKHIMLMVDIPHQGGAPLDEIIVEARNHENFEITPQRYPFNGETMYRFIRITSGQSYQFRSRGVNTVGEGVNSPWSDVVAIPTEDEILRLAQVAKQGKDLSTNLGANTRGRRGGLSVQGLPSAPTPGAAPPAQPKI